MDWLVMETVMQRMGLTERERETARLYVAGLTIAQVAAVMYIEVQTVKRHLSGIYRKAGIAPGCGSHRKVQLIRLLHGAPACVPMIREAA